MNTKHNLRVAFSLFLTLAACFAAGCDKNNAGSSSGSSPAEKRTAAPADFLQRYQAAIQINEIGKRDDALDVVARDAAKGGDADVVKQALMGISNINTRDTSASAAAVALAKAGKRAEGTAVARLINSISLRDSTLARLAGE